MKGWPLSLDYPPIWTALFALLIWLIGRALPSGAALLVAVGWLIVLASLALMVWAAVYFKRAATSINPHGQPTALITGGPFNWSRNPIYLADALLLIGLCLALRALPALLLIPIFISVLTRRFIIPEEARLAAAFPVDFAAYAKRVRRWL